MPRACVLLIVALAGSIHAEPPPPVIPIAEAIRDSNGDTIPDRIRSRVHVRGVVTIASNLMAEDRMQAYLQDETAGTYIFSRRVDGLLVPGDLVDVVGVVEQYRGAVQIKRPTVTKLGRAPLPAPQALTIPQAASWKMYGRLVRVTGVKKGLRTEGPNLAFAIEADGGRMHVLLPPGVMRDFSLESVPDGSKVDVRGVVSIYSQVPPYRTGFRLIVGSPDWVTVRSRPLPAWIRRTVLAGAALIAVGVLTAFAVRAMSRRARRRSHHVATLNSLAAMAAGVVDVERFLPEAIALMRNNGIIDGAVVHLLEGKRLRLHGAWDVQASKAHALDGEIQSRLGHRLAERDLVIAEPTSFLTGRGSATTEPVICVPLQGRSGTVGVLTAFPDPSHPISMSDAEVVAAAANLIALGIENVNMIRMSEERQRELEQLAISDPLTGLYNRRFMEEYLRIHMAMAERNRTPVSFISIDFDHFKHVNDTHGHDIGDAVLAEFGGILREIVRAADLPVRYGGEEFLVVMTDTSEAGALTFTSRLQEVLRGHRFSSAPDVRVTVSIGIAVYPDHGSTVRDLLRVADESLYESKRQGRDRVTVGQGTTQFIE